MKNFIYSFSLIFSAVFFTVHNIAAMYIDFIFSDNSLIVSESFTMEVWVKEALIPDDEVIAFGFDFYISDNTGVALEGFTVDPLFFDDSDFFDNTQIAGSVFPIGITNSSFMLATLELTAEKEGIYDS